MTTPTRDLLPGYAQDQRWLDLCDALDSVFASNIGTGQRALRYLRHLFVLGTAPTVEEDIQAHKLLSASVLDHSELDLQVKQIGTVGLNITHPSGLGTQALSNLYRNLGMFWFSKGLFDFVDFMSYALNVQITIENLWTNDYVTFLPEGDPGIGTPVYQSGGTWYPTTHVNILYVDNVLTSIPPDLIVGLWKDISNYNLVLNSMAADVYMHIGDENDPLVQYPATAALADVEMAAFAVEEISFQNY